MRGASIGFAALAAVMAAGLSPGQAQESFFSSRFCAQGGGGRGSGIPDCSYNTWEQCVASARGLGRYCTENPNWRPTRNERPSRSRQR